MLPYETGEVSKHAALRLFRLRIKRSLCSARADVLVDGSRAMESSEALIIFGTQLEN